MGIAHAPRNVLQKRMLPLVDEQLAEVEKHAADPGQYGLGDGAGADEYWDDKCLTNFLRGICLRYIAYPDPDAVLDPADEQDILEKRAEAEKDARVAFEQIFQDGPKVVYDHYLVYHARGCLRSEWPRC